MDEVKQEWVAEKLLWGLWRGIDEAYKMKYPRDIWDHFENALKSASYTSNLKGFLERFQKRIPMRLERQYMKDVLSVVECGQDDLVMGWLRYESTYMMMLVRVKNQTRKDDYAAMMAEKEAALNDFLGKNEGLPVGIGDVENDFLSKYEK